MKKFSLILVILTAVFASASAQSVKFGHLNLQEVISLTAEMDSAVAIMERYQADLQETMSSMQNEYYTKVNNYQQMSANWTAAVLQAKQQEIQELEQRIQTFQQNAQQEMQQKQAELIRPIYEAANKAVSQIGKDGGFTYIFDISATGIPYINESQSIDVTDKVKTALNIPLDKVLRTPQQAASAQ